MVSIGGRRTSWLELELEEGFELPHPIDDVVIKIGRAVHDFNKLDTYETP